MSANAQILRLLVDAGATAASATRAAEVLDRGGSIREAGDEIVLENEPNIADGELVVFEALLTRELVRL